MHGEQAPRDGEAPHGEQASEATGQRLLKTCGMTLWLPLVLHAPIASGSTDSSSSSGGTGSMPFEGVQRQQLEATTGCLHI